MKARAVSVLASKWLAVTFTMTAMLAACNPLQLIFGTAPPPSVSGSFTALGNDAYDPNGPLYIPPNVNPNPHTAAQAFASKMTGAGWKQQLLAFDTSVTAGSVTGSVGNSDALWYSGHGDVGLMELYYGEELGHSPNNTSWGPGDNQNTYPSNTSGMPFNGRLKWIFSYSSTTVGAPAALLPNMPTETANWLQLFGGALHGIYGFWQRPGNCPLGGTGVPTDPNLICDIGTAQADAFADSLVSHLLGQNPQETVHSAWVNAASDVGYGDMWSMWEDAYNYGDVLSGPGGSDNGTSGSILFYYALNTNGSYTDNPVSVGKQTFVLQPTTLTPESISDSQLLTNAVPYYGNPDSYTNTGTLSIATKGATSVIHELATGAVSYHGVRQINALAFSESTALSVALQAAQGINGLPADAVLTETAEDWEVDPTTGGSIPTGYLFTWKHSGAPRGNDAIRVAITDYQTSNSVCTGGTKAINDPPNPPIVICIGYTTTYVDQPNVAYMFRMWRSIGSPQSTQSLGTTSITAAAAAASLPAAATIIAYSSGSWSGAYDDPTNNDATPAWVFTLSSGRQIYVDAYTGKVLGSVGN